MRLVYSALRHVEKNRDKKRITARFRGYQAACNKHQSTIAAIQQFMPGWAPDFQETAGCNNKQ